jgi:hypothetical protein
MALKTSTTEELFLKIFKFAMLVIMSLTLLITAGSLVFAAYQYNQSPKTPAPAQKAPAKSIDTGDFLKQLKSETPKAEAPPAVDAPKPESAGKPEPVKYQDEVVKIYACYKESNKQANIGAINTGDDEIENFRKQVQRIADSKNADRGQAYVTDAAKVVCDILANPQVTEYRKSRPEPEFFFDVVNFHIESWDQLKAEEKKFESDEEARVDREQQEEALRVEVSKEAAKLTLLVAAGAFVLFMALALYLIVAAIETNLRRIGLGIEALTQTHTPAPVPETAETPPVGA